MFAILNTKTNKLATLSFSSNGDAEFCNDTTCTVDFNDSVFFIAEKREIAEKVLTNNEDWYNSSALSPKWGYDFQKNLSNLKVVELQIKS
jgi:hypothetical protein